MTSISWITESVNHMLIQRNLEARPLLDFIDDMNEMVDAQFKVLWKALISTAQYRLVDSHRHFLNPKVLWAAKTYAKHDKCYKWFQQFTKKDPKLVIHLMGQLQLWYLKAEEGNLVKRKAQWMHKLKWQNTKNRLTQTGALTPMN